jgi:uncharacterized protein with ParB-like and HNH nuclease domain
MIPCARLKNTVPKGIAYSLGTMLNTRTISYLELIGNGKRYRVPPYQRDYSWNEEQWDDLWNDIVDLHKQTDSYHYMGALVVQAESDRDLHYY